MSFLLGKLSITTSVSGELMEFGSVNAILRAELRTAYGRESEPSAAILDSQSV